MIQLANQLDCTGCFACVNICKQNSIDIHVNEEGFSFPYINTNLCVECGACVKVCPIIQSNRIVYANEKKQTAYALISYQDRSISSSGGAFSVFARWILNQGGTVFGATIDENLQVYHINIKKLEQLNILRGSKYVQSQIKNTYREAKECLKENQKVLFTGTPCQIAGLYSYLNGNRYEGLLYTLDLVCHGVPSQKNFDAYLDKIKIKISTSNSNIEAFRFRRFDSWDYQPAIKFKNSKWYNLKYAENAYMNAFFEGLIFRESCYRCNFCKINRVGTFTIADFWGIGKHGHKFSKNVASGVSLVIDNFGLMSQIENDLRKYAYIEKRWVDEAIAEQINLKEPLKRKNTRDIAVKAFIDPDVKLEKFCQMVGLPHKRTFKTTLKELVKMLVYKLGLYNIYKTISYKLS